jgi:uncharacterized repeat protein (TIGR01451 family)
MSIVKMLIGVWLWIALSVPAMATTFTETVPNGNGPIPDTFPPVGGTMFVLVGVNGNIYYQFVNPSTQFEGFAGTGAPAAFRGIPTFQLGPEQVLNCGIVSCSDYFGGAIAEGYSRLTVRDADACPGNFDFEDVTFLVNGIDVSSLSNLGPNDVQRTNLTGTSQIANTENCFRNQGTGETSTAWFDLPGNVLNDILTSGSTTPFIRDDDTGRSTTRGDNAWFFQDGVDATGTPEVAPGITIEKTADRSSYDGVGDVINYSFLVTNIGSVQLNDIVVDDSFIIGTVSCPLTSLVTGQTMTCTGQHIVSQQNVDDDVVFVNTASVTANPSEGTLGNVSGTLTIPGPDATNMASLTKSASPRVDLNVGDEVTYTYVVVNTGNITLSDVSIADVHGGSGNLSAITPMAVSLAPTESQSFTATYIVTQDDFEAGSIDNTATITATPARGNFTSPEATEQVTMATPTPEASFSKLASPTSDVAAGDLITYTYRVDNTGDVTLENVTIADVHNGNGALSAITPASATIAPGGFAEFTANYTVLQSDVDANAPITNTATAALNPARGSLADLTDDASVGVAAEPSATFTKTADPKTDLQTGDIVTYSYVVTNTGNIDLVNLSVSDVHGGMGSLSAISPASLPLLAAGDNATFTASYEITLQDFEDGSNIDNQATLSFTPERGTLAPLTANETISIAGPTPNAVLSKTASPATELTAGAEVTYTYNVENTGDVTLTDLSISDVHQGTGTLSAITPATVPVLAIDDNVDFTATYIVTQEDIDSGVDITNIATLSATSARGTLPVITDDAVITIEAANPLMTLLKTATPAANVKAGDIVTYTYDAENTGNVTMTAVSVSDIHSGAGTLSAITPANVTLAPGETQRFTASYEVTQDDIDAGLDITNDATLNGTPERGTYIAALDDAVVTVEAPTPTMTIAKTADKAADLTVGETVIYSYVVENTGNVTFDLVSISDVHDGVGVLSAIMPGSINDFAPGDIVTFTASYEIEQGDLDAGGPITNEATLNGTPRLGDYAALSDTETVTLIAPDANLALVKTANPTANVAVGDIITYSYAVENIGNVTMQNVSITDVHSGEGSLSAITPANVTSLAPNETTSFTASYEVTQADIDSGVDITNIATANATPMAGSYTPVSDDARVTQTDAVPQVLFTKTADITSELSVGDIVTYTYRAENTGNVTLSNVAISDVHEGTGPLSAITPASFATVAVGQIVNFTANYEITQADIDAGVPITNEASLTADPARGTLPPTTADARVTLDAAAPEITLDKRALTAEFTAVGDELSYEYELENTGNVTLENLVVEDDRIALVTCPVTALAPGETTLCLASYEVTQADLNAGSVVNIATVNGDPASGTLAPQTDTETVNAVQSPELSLDKDTDDTTFAAIGDELSYSYTVTNTGNVEITDIAISDDRIAVVACPETTLAPGEMTICTASYSVTQDDLDAGEVTNIASATGTPAGGDLTDPEDSVTITGDQTPNLEIEKTALDTSFAAVGDVLDYEYLVTNTGNVTIIDPITVSDDRIASVSCPALPAGGLAPTQSLTCSASYAVTQADLDAAIVTNIASASDGTTTSPTDSASVNGIQTPSLMLVKTANEPDFAAVGDILTYNYSVTNTGNVRIGDITVSDDLIAAVSCNVPAIGNGDAFLDPSEIVVCTANYSVTQADLNTGSVTNNASATGTPAGGSLAPALDDATVSADQLPELRLTKAANETSFAAVGDALTYNFTVENSGNVEITNISVSDDRIASISCPVTRLMPGESVICTGTDIVSQIDIDAGSVVNNAAATGDPSGGVLTDPTAQETVDAIQSPAFDIEKNAVTVNFVSPGDISSYEYVITNTGNVTLTDPITVTDNLIPVVTCPALPAGGLAPNATLTCSADYVVTQADLDAGSVTNLASASDGTTTSAQTSATIPATQDPALSIVKSSVSTEITTAGQIVTYDFTVRNDGNLTLTGGVDVVDDKIGRINCIAGNLIPGATANCSADYVVTQADLDAGFVTNQAFAENDRAVSAPVDLTLNAAQAPSLSFAKSAVSASFTNAGDVINYEFRLENTGNVTLTDVSVSDALIPVISCPSTTLLPAEVITCTGAYSVTQDDVDAGEVINNASASAAPPGGAAPITPTSSATVDAASNPSFTFEKRATRTEFAAVGDILTYEFDVVNTGSVTLNDILITDDLIAAVNCPVTTLAPSASTICSANYTVIQADIDAGSVINNAGASASPADGSIVDDLTSQATVSADQAPELSLEKRAITADFAAVGDVLSYEYDIVNIGNVNITNLSVSDDRIAAVSCPVTALAPGESTICTADYSVTQADIDAGSVTNIASVDGTPSGGNLTPPVDSATIDAVQSPELAIVKTALTADFSAVGDVLNYEYDVTNSGNITITDPISVSDDRIASVLCPALPSGGLAPNDSLTCTASYIVTQADIDTGNVTNIASASDGTNRSLPDDAVVNAVQAPSLAMTKTGTPQLFTALGETVSYDYVITNTGNVTITEPITVSDDRISMVSCPALPLVGLLPGESLTCSASDNVTQADLDAGFIENTAQASDGTITTDDVTETVNADQTPALELDKTVLDASFNAVGDIINYTYAVTNTGNVTITDSISVSDDRISSVSCPALPGGSLAPGNSVTCTANYTITQADLDAGFVTNIAVASIPGTRSPEDTATTNADQAPALSIVKTALEASFVNIGDVLSYEYLVRNTGNVTLMGNVSVTDDRISAVSCPSISPQGFAPNETISCTASYSVTQADIDAGDVTNIASARNGETVSPTDTAVVTADQQPGLQTVKRALQVSYDAVGDVVSYEYDVINTGNTTITAPITVSDNRISNVVCPALPAGGLAPSAAITCAADYVITQDDIDLGFVENIAASSDGTTGSAPVTERVEATQTPALSIDKTALDNNFAVIGDVISYEYLVTNTGNVTLTDAVTVSDDRIASVNCPALPAGGLAPTMSLTCTASYSVTQADIDAGSVTNIASAASGATDSGDDSVTVNGTQTPSLSIVKTANQASFTAVGDVLSYDYAVTNTGNITLSGNIMVDDDRIDSVLCPALPAGGLAPSGVVTCTASYIVTQADIDAGDVTNIASARNGETVSPADTAVVTANQQPALDIIKRALETTYSNVGDQIGYEFDVSNIGNTTITNPITVSDDRIASVNCPALPAGGLIPGGSITCSGVYSVTQQDLDDGVVENIASATDGVATSPVVNRRVFATRNALLEIDKEAVNVNFTLPGDIVTYNYTVTNAGNVTVTDPITVDDNLIAAVICPALPAGGLAPGASLVCTADYVVTLDNLDVGVVVNIATATAGDVSSAPTSETIPDGANPAIELRKSSQDTSFAAVGDVLTYEFEIENTGNVTLVNTIEVVDNRIGTIPCFAGPTFIPNQIERCTADYTVTQADIDAGFVTNDAFAMHPRTSSPPDFVTIPAVQNPQIGLTKTAQTPQFAQVGDVINYDYIVTNIGNVTLVQDVSVTDDQIANVSCEAMPAGGLAVNASVTCTGSDIVTQADLDAGFIINNAAASDGTTTSDSVQERVNAAQTPSLGFVKTALDSDFTAVGDSLDYSYLVTNTGNITITDPITVSDDRIASVSCPALPAGGLAPNASVTCTGSDLVTQADLDAGVVTNIASASDGTTTSDTDTASVSGTQTPALEIVKTSQQTRFADVGDVLSYDYDVTNIGNVTLTDAITVNDDRIANVTCPALPAGGLAPRGSITCSADYSVTQDDIDAGSVTNIASARSGAVVSDDDSLTINGEQTPALTLVKTALDNSFAAIGDRIDYEYVVTNTGNVTLTRGIDISDDRISSVNCPALPAGGLAVNASLTCTASDRVDQADIDAGIVTNMAVASDGVITSPSVEESVSGDQTPALSLAKTALDSDFTAVGDTLNYSYLVTNTGNITITDPITVSDDRIDSVTCPVLPTGGLLPGGSLTCTATDNVTQADLDAGFVTNTASASDGNISSNTSSQTVSGTQSPNLTIEKSSEDTTFAVAGDVLSYTYEVFNLGNVTLTDAITVSDDRIANVICPALPAGGLIPGDSIICAASDVVTQADVDAGFVMNTAFASDGTLTTSPVSLRINGAQTPEMSLVKNALTSEFATVGETLSYEYIVTNTGNITLTSAIMITDDRIAVIACPALPAGGLVPDASITCTASDNVTQADLDAGFVTNIAQASDGTISSDAMSATVTGAQSSGLEIEKLAMTSDYTALGDELLYSYIVRNTGNVTLTEPITVSDDRIADVTCPALPSGGLLPDATITCDAVYSVTQNDIDFGSVTNIASATDGTVTSPTDSVTVNGTQQPALGLVKTSPSDAFNAVGQVITYNYEVTNIGNVTLTTALTVSDDRIASVTCPALPEGGLVPDASIMCSADYSVTQADIDAGFVTNIASASNGVITSAPVDLTIDAVTAPSLSLVKTALTTEFSGLGDILSYEYLVTNTGNITITNPITVSDDRIDAVSCPALPAGGLAPNASLTCTAQDVVTQADLDAGSVTNIASASDGTTTSDTDTASVSGTQTAALEIVKTALSADYAAVGDVLSYRYNVTNAGNVTITAPITVSDDRIDAVTCPALPAGGLAPNASLTCSADYVVTQADLDAGSVTNIASASDGNITSPADDATVDARALPALEIVKTSPDATYAELGQILTYNYSVTNTGNVTFTAPITVSDDRIADVTCPALPSGGLVPAAALSCTASYAVTQLDLDAGEVTNIASASDGTTASEPVSLTIEATALPALAIVKTATTESFAMPGDIISYEYIVTNTGNVTLNAAITVNDDKIEAVSCPALPAGGLAPQASLTCRADYDAVQADIDAGFVTNIASGQSGDIISEEVSETVEAQRLPAMNVLKTARAPQQVFGPIYDVIYELEMENTGNVTLTDMSLEDNLTQALAPSTLIGTPQVSLADFTTGAANDNYNGADNIELLAEGTSLAVGETGSVTLLVRIDTTEGGPAQGNTAVGANPELASPAPSNDPSVTPNETGDVNPTPLSIIDTDGDGAPDNFESDSEDRDGDGIPDSEDYDPTGYFYCEENGTILTGGGITVTGPNGSNSSIGTANNIVILEDGSDGFYQFYVTAPGEYRLTPTYPVSGVASTSRLPNSDALDVTDLLPDNPATIGSTELGDTGQLADFTADSNSPFYTSFIFEEGDPAVFANNFPLQHCGEPAVELTKETVGDVELTADGRQQVSYNFTIENTGETLIENVQVTDNLGDVFGAGNVDVVSLALAEQPSGFTANVNMAYNGVTTLDMLTDGGRLQSGERVTLNLVIIAAPETDGEAVNIAVLSASEPLNGGPLTDNGSAAVELQALSDPSFVRVAKRAQPRTVQIGDPVLYTIDVTNDSGSTMTDLRITDRIPLGFAYIPGTAVISDASVSAPIEPLVTGRGFLNWDISQTAEAPLDTLAAGETLSVSLRLLAGPNVEFGAHENQAFAESLRTGERSEVASAIVDYIPEPSFDCTPILGRVYDDVNHNGYPDDGEPGLPAVRLVTVNGDIITTDQYGRYHIPCAAIADRERGSNFLLKADARTLPLGYHLTSENPRVVRVTRGKFVKMNFGAAHRPKLRLDLFAADFGDEIGLMEPQAAARVKTLLAAAKGADRALIIYHADDLEHVDNAQAKLKIGLEVVKSLAPKQFKDIALEASWGDAAEFTPPNLEATENLLIGSLYDRPAVDGPQSLLRDRVAFTQSRGGALSRLEDNDEIYDNRGAFNGSDNDERFSNTGDGGLRGQRGSAPLASDNRGQNSSPLIGRRDQGEAETPRPGRLMRWVGWGEKTTSYAEGLEIETTVDALNPVKRLNAQANVVSDINGRDVRVETYSNYKAFITRLELRLFPEGRSVRSEPAAIIPVSGRYGQLPVSAYMSGEYSYVLRAYGASGDFDETAKKPLVIGDAEYDLTGDEWAYQASTAFGQNTLLKDNIRVRGGAVRVYGRNVPGESVSVMGQNIAVDPQGLFIAEQLLPAGKQSVEVRIAGLNGGEQRILRSVDVKARDTFYAAQIEATIGEQATADGDNFEQGRVAFYVRSRLNDRWSVTATADTGEADIGNLLSGLDDKDLGQLLRRLDPDRFYPTYGDDSTIEQDAPTSGRFYARIERDDDYALWGNYQTNFNDTEFARVQRTLYGAKFHWDENGNTTKFGDDRTRVTAFIAEGGTRQGRDEFRGTGGSVYYLRQGDISIGSEILRLQTRDSVSGLVIENRRLVYGTDYDLDFIQGRIILNQPLGSTGDDGRLFRDGSQGGNQQILVVDYEFSPVIGSDDGAAVYGARGARWFGDHVKIGATYNHDTDGGEESDLFALDLTLQYAAGTYIKGEVARSEGQGVETFRSIDGGFTFNPQDRGGINPERAADAYAVEAAVDFSEIKGFNLTGNSYGYWRKRDAGFAGFAESTNQAIEQFGGGLTLALSPRLSISARADITDERTTGTNSFAEGRADYQLGERLAASIGLSFTDDARGNAGTSIGGRVDYKLNDDNKIYAFGQVGLEGQNTRTTDRIGAGAEVRLSKHIYGGGEISTGEDGLGARASLRYQYEDGDEFYVAYDLPLRARPTANLGTFNLGARRRYGDALSVFGEERLQFNDRGLNGITHAYGVDYKPGNWNFGLTAETGRVDDLDRDAFSATVGFASERLKAGLTGEWRSDENVDTADTRRTWLLRSSALYQASEELRLQGKFNLAVSDQSRPDVALGPQSFNEAEFREASLSAAYRPIWDDRFNLIGKLVWLEDLSPTSQRFNGETLNYRQKSQIASIDAAYDLSPKWTLGGKYAYRSGSVTSNRESLDFTNSEAQLGVIRLDYHLTNRWDALVEGRYLDIGNGVTSRMGGQVGVFRHLNDNAKIGLGLTYGGIEEQYLAVVGREEDIGWYFNVIGKF